MDIDTRRQLGKTSLSVSQLGFGSAPLGNMYRAFPDAVAASTVSAAYEVGVRLFDTAPLYGHGLAEHRLGAALRAQPRDSYVLCSKVGRLLDPCPPEQVDAGIFHSTLPFEPRYDYSYDGVMRSFEDSLQRLGTHRIDILLIHDVDIWTHGSKAASEQRIAEVMQGGYRALRELRDEGVINAIGAGVNDWETCQTLAEQGDFDCFLLAGRYTLLEQDALNSFLPLCEQRNISIIVGGPYNTGILATGAIEGAYYNYQPASPAILDRVRRIEAICQRFDVNLASAALQFPLGHPAVACIIPGARDPDEVRQNQTIFGVDIPSELWLDLKTEGLLRQDAPTPA